MYLKRGGRMIKYFAKMTVGAGMHSAELIEAKDEEEALSHARELCIDLASSYGYYQDEDYFGEQDSIYQEDSWDEETEEYTDISDLEYYVEVYDPEEHDGYLN